MQYQTYQPTWNNPYLQQQQMQYMPQMQQASGYQAPYNGITKVKSRDSALQQCTLPPNSTSDPMFNETEMVFYVVSTDGIGTKSIEEFTYSPKTYEQPQQQVQIDGSMFASRQELDELAAKVNEMSAILEAQQDGTDEPAQPGDVEPARPRSSRSRKSAA